MPYNSQYAPQIARLLMEQGQTAAQQQADRGRIWGGAVQGIGQQVSRRLSDLMREKQEAPIRAQQAESRDLTLRGLRRDDAAAAREVEQAEALKRAQSPEEIMQILGPERGPKVLQGFAALKEQNQKSFASTQQLIGTVAMANKALPEPMRQEAWDESISMLAQRGLITPEDAPKTPDVGAGTAAEENARSQNARGGWYRNDSDCGGRARKNIHQHARSQKAQGYGAWP
jgi:hypothetical protein